MQEREAGHQEQRLVGWRREHVGVFKARVGKGVDLTDIDTSWNHFTNAELKGNHDDLLRAGVESPEASFVCLWSINGLYLCGNCSFSYSQYTTAFQDMPALHMYRTAELRSKARNLFTQGKRLPIQKAKISRPAFMQAGRIGTRGYAFLSIKLSKFNSLENPHPCIETGAACSRYSLPWFISIFWPTADLGRFQWS